jgi:hypothetical protein
MFDFSAADERFLGALPFASSAKLPGLAIAEQQFSAGSR